MQLRMITTAVSRLFSAEYCPPDRYWHSVSPPWPSAGKFQGAERGMLMNSALRCASGIS
jgi:hypothetical protein